MRLPTNGSENVTFGTKGNRWSALSNFVFLGETCGDHVMVSSSESLHSDSPGLVTQNPFGEDDKKLSSSRFVEISTSLSLFWSRSATTAAAHSSHSSRSMFSSPSSPTSELASLTEEWAIPGASSPPSSGVSGGMKEVMSALDADFKKRGIVDELDQATGLGESCSAMALDAAA